MSERPNPIPAYDLYGESGDFPDILHCERFSDRATALGWRIPPHRHGLLHQFFHLPQPGARATVDGQDMALEGPSLLSVPRFHVHSFVFPPGLAGHVLSLRPATLPDLFGEGAEMPGAFSVPRLAVAEPGIPEIFEEICRERMRRAPLRGARLKALATLVAAGVLRGDDGAEEAGARAPGLDHMRRFEALVRERMSVKPGVGWYAGALAISPEHLGRVTREHAAISPGRFVERVLMEEARRQLVYTRTPIAGIGYALGYEDPAHFSRVFRRHEGTSPSEYRRSRSDFS